MGVSEIKTNSMKATCFGEPFTTRNKGHGRKSTGAPLTCPPPHQDPGRIQRRADARIVHPTMIVTRKSPIMPITGHRVLTPELDADIRKAMQEWSIPRAVLLYMDEIPVEQHIHLDGKRLVRRTRRGKWTVKMYGPQERRASMEVSKSDAQLMETSFNIGQVADFFTAYAVRLCLKRAGKQWTMRVQEVLPEFRISNDSDKSAECTLADLASHRTGVRAWPGLDPDRNDIVSLPRIS